MQADCEGARRGGVSWLVSWPWGPLTFAWDGVSQIVKGKEDPTAISSHSLAPQPRPSPKASITHEV